MDAFQRVAQRPADPVRWPLWLALANLFLAVSVILLSLPLLSAYGLASPALGLTLLADEVFTAVVVWPVFFAAVISFAQSRAEIASGRQMAAVASAILGLTGFVAGMAALPLAFPARVSSYFCAYEWDCVLFSFWFPYVPSVFASVVLSHAAISWIGAHHCRDDIAARRLRGASAMLVIVCVASLITQLAGLLDGWAWGLVCLTAPGYLLAAAAAWRESRGRATAILWRGPSRPSPDPWP